MAEFDIMYNEGISRYGDLLDLAVSHDIIEKRGSYYSYGEERLGQGRETAKDYLRDKPELAETIEEQLRAEVLEQQPAAFAEEDTEEAYADSEQELEAVAA